jgi:hypothetical protein
MCMTVFLHVFLSIQRAELLACAIETLSVLERVSCFFSWIPMREFPYTAFVYVRG